MSTAMDAATTKSPQTVSQPMWQVWSGLPWLKRGSPGSGELQLCLRILEAGIVADNVSALLRETLPEIAAELAAVWVAVVSRGEQWTHRGEFGRLPLDALPFRLLTEALDRD